MTLWTTHLGAHSWGRALLLKSGLLGFGFLAVFWAGWPQPRHGAFDHAVSPLVGAQSVVSLGGSSQLLSGAPVSAPEILGSTGETANGKTLPVEQVSHLVNLNGGSRVELATLPGIGLVLADRIIAYRLTHGPFQQVDELVNVPGIGAKRFRRLGPLLTVEAVLGKIGN
ncbi:MAG: helix-hairpin-helix domain-containing protein [Nitrospirota bacterium]|nr:helix-hairpin-helix domain-containing protein [Nitrospirota bacterium]